MVAAGLHGGLGRRPASARGGGAGPRAPRLRRTPFAPACRAVGGGGGGSGGGDEGTPKRPSPQIQRAAARAAVDGWVKPGSVVGIGTGELVSAAIEYLAQQAAKGELRGVVAVPSSTVAAREAAFQGLPLGSLEQHPKVDVYLEQADQADPAGNAYLKGIRAEPVQPDLPSAAALLAAAAKVVVLADGADVVPRLAGSLPVAIEAEGWEAPAEELDDIFLGDAELWRRPAEGTSNPRGGDNPYVSEDGAFTIVDVRFYEGLKLYGEDEEYARIAEEIEGVPGVLAHGLVAGRAEAFVVADAAKGAEVLRPQGAGQAEAAAAGGSS